MNDLVDPLLTDVHGRIRQALLLGLARQPLAVPPSLNSLIGRMPSERDPTLALLALVGQRQRFVLPELPVADAVSEAARRMHDDPRPILPPVARRALSRLTASVEKAFAGPVLSLAVRRVGESGCRVHPFDLPNLATHIKDDADSLGLAERAFLALTASERDDDGARGLFFERITAENWTTFPKASRRAFVADQRRQDAAAGRALVESVWKSEQAPMRAALLEALATGLCLDDKPFLDSLSGDRAESVKQTAARLLARMPSTEDDAQRLAAAAACFKAPRKGIVGGLLSGVGLSGGAGLVFAVQDGTVKVSKNRAEAQAALPQLSPNYVGPGLVNGGENQTTRERLFSGLRLAELAEAAGTVPDEIIAALPANEHQVFKLLLDTAVADADLPIVRRLVSKRLLSSKTLPAHLLSELVSKACVALTEDEAEQLLAAPAWADAIKAFREATMPLQFKDDGRLVFMAALMPRASVPAFIQSLVELSPVSTRAAKDFADLILALPDATQTNPI